MSEEPTFLAAPDEPIAIEAGRMRNVRARDLAIRFAFGAVTSIAAALISLAFGARAGGLLLAFPAILAASLTLIENEDSQVAGRLRHWTDAGSAGNGGTVAAREPEELPAR